MDDIHSNFAIPRQLAPFIDNGFLEVLSQDKSRRTIEFHMPSKRFVDAGGRMTTYSLIWIHPEYNAEFCHYHDRAPGDVPNFWITEDVEEVGNEQVDGLQSVDDLVVWLTECSASGCV